MDKVCPFCGAELTPESFIPTYQCLTWYESKDSSYVRSEDCYEAQLTAQSALLNECLDVVRVVGNTLIDMGSIHPDGLPAKYLSAYEGMLLFGPKATALLPMLENAVAKEKP